MATYPSCINLSEHCNKCNTGQSYPGCANRNNGQQACSVYCNSGCNTVCNSAQGICKVHSQFIKNHADVGAYPGSTI